MKRPQTKPALLFRLVVPVTVVFILTILALIACLFGDPNAPVSRWLNEHGNQLLIVEFVAVIVLSLLAMVVDRVRTLRGIEEEPFDPPAAAATTAMRQTPVAAATNTATDTPTPTATAPEPATAAERGREANAANPAADTNDPPSSSAVADSGS